MVCVSECLSACLFVYNYSHTTGYEAAYGQYQPLQYYMYIHVCKAIHIVHAGCDEGTDDRRQGHAK